MKNLTKKYLVWNYLIIVPLISLILVFFAGQCFKWSEGKHSDNDMFIGSLICSIIWLCIVPFFVKNLAKKRNYKPKKWFLWNFIIALIPLLMSIACIIWVPRELRYAYIDEDWSILSIPISNYNRVSLFWLCEICSLFLPVLTFALFLLFRYLHKLDNTAINSSKENFFISDICPHCKNPNTKKTQKCEWCGNEIY